jgi:succinate dehydrogenase / fumarate reductase cytochrome b subunit
MTENEPKIDYSEFLLRRLHSLTGIVPLAGFIIFHFFENSYSTKGLTAYNARVDALRGLPFLQAIEWGLLLGPFLFHMLYGLWIIFTGQSNPIREPYRRNYAYVLQRISALVVFVFIIYHVVGLRFLEPAYDRTTGKLDYYTYLKGTFQNPMIYWWYVVGIGSTAYHLANGICTFCMTWGITIGRTAQRYTAYAMTVLGLIIFLMGINAINGFNRPSPERPAAHDTASTIGGAQTRIALR